MRDFRRLASLLHDVVQYRWLGWSGWYGWPHNWQYDFFVICYYWNNFVKKKDSQTLKSVEILIFYSFNQIEMVLIFELHIF